MTGGADANYVAAAESMKFTVYVLDFIIPIRNRVAPPWVLSVWQYLLEQWDPLRCYYSQCHTGSVAMGSETPGTFSLPKSYANLGTF